MSKLPKFLFGICLAVALAGAAEDKPTSSALQSLVSAERNFAQTAAEHGVPASFLQFLAEDSLVFAPGPTNGKNVYKKRKDDGQRLSWQPVFATISNAGDLGCTTGPWNFKKNAGDEKPSAFGEFVSIWKRQPDNSWKVILNIGIDHSAPPGPAAEIELSPPDTLPDLSPEIARTRLEIAEHKLEHALEDNNADVSSSVITISADRIRFLREDQLPAVGQEAGKTLLNSEQRRRRQSLGGGVSGSADLAYNYGSYSTENNIARGYFFSLWKLDRTGDWKLLLDLETKIPKPK